MNDSQRMTVQYADQVKQNYIALEPILNAAISGKVIEHVSGARSDERPLRFNDEACQYEIVKDKVKVYQIIYKVPYSGHVEAFSTAKKEHYDNYRSEVLKSVHNLVILKETVEEFEV